MRKWFLIIIFLAEVASGSALQNLSVGINARATAMGEAFCAMPYGLNGMFYNPASIGAVRMDCGDVTYFKSFLDQSYMSLNFGSPGQKRVSSNKAYGLVYYDGGQMAVNRLDGTSSSVSVEQDVVLSYGFGRMLKKGFSYGFTGKIIYSRLAAEYSAAAVAVDAGMQFRAGKDIRLGVALQNLGTPLKYDSESESIPAIIRSGISLVKEKFTAGFDVNKTMDSAGLKMNLGVEYRINSGDGAFAVRGGYKTDAGRQGVSLGFGYLFDGRNAGINYSFQDLGSSSFQRMTLSWGMTPPSKTEVTPTVESVPEVENKYYSLSGRVVNPANRNLPGTTVKLSNGNVSDITAQTDAKGQFYIEEVLEGEYELTAWHEGYHLVESILKIQGKNKKIKITMEKQLE